MEQQTKREVAQKLQKLMREIHDPMTSIGKQRALRRQINMLAEAGISGDLEILIQKKTRNTHKLRQELQACRVKRIQAFLAEDLQQLSTLRNLKLKITQILGQPKLEKLLRAELGRVLDQVLIHVSQIEKEKKTTRKKRMVVLPQQQQQKDQTNADLKWAYRTRGDAEALFLLSPKTQEHLLIEDDYVLYNRANTNSNGGKRPLLDSEILEINQKMEKYCEDCDKLIL